jgi:hypothetical protein
LKSPTDGIKKNRNLLPELFTHGNFQSTKPVEEKGKKEGILWWEVDRVFNGQSSIAAFHGYCPSPFRLAPIL